MVEVVDISDREAEMYLAIQSDAQDLVKLSLVVDLCTCQQQK